MWISQQFGADEGTCLTIYAALAAKLVAKKLVLGNYFDYTFYQKLALGGAESYTLCVRGELKCLLGVTLFYLFFCFI